MSYPTLPDVSTAKLPATYEAAKHALSECSRIDECQQWADKAEAMASYAKQSKDDSLRKMADRIQARAIRRCGELLKQIEPQPGKRTDLEPSVGTVTRLQAAEDAGLSERQRVTAIRVASIPEESFNDQVESESPPTVTQLAEQGKKPLVNLEGIPASDYARATEAQGTLRRFAEFCATNDPVRIARSFKPHEVQKLRAHVSTVDAWLDLLITNLPE